MPIVSPNTFHYPHFSVVNCPFDHVSVKSANFTADVSLQIGQCYWHWVICSILQITPKKKIWACEVWWIWRPWQIRSSRQDSVRKHFPKIPHGHTGCVRCCFVLLEPLMIHLHWQSLKTGNKISSQQRSLILNSYSFLAYQNSPAEEFPFLSITSTQSLFHLNAIRKKSQYVFSRCTAQNFFVFYDEVLIFFWHFSLEIW